MAHIDDPQTQRANLDYIRNAMDEPLLEKAHERELLKRWVEDKDERALHDLTKPHMRLVVSIASRFRNYGLPMGDLIQEGNIGLMQAAQRFDIKQDVRFSTYATWWIRAAIQDYVLRNWSIVRTGTTAAQKSLFFNLRKLRAKIEGRNEREGLGDEGRAEIAKELNVKVKDVEAMESRLSGSDPSLNAKIGEEENNEWQDLLADESLTPEEFTTDVKDAQTRSAWLGEALTKLSDREQKIIKDRHLTYETVTLESLGKDLGISKERVRQLEQRAMIKLKDTMSDYIGDQTNMF